MEKLEKQVNKIIEQAIESIADRYLAKLKELIEKYVYHPNEPDPSSQNSYKRTGEFLESFVKLPQVKKIIKEFMQEVYFEPNKLSYGLQPSGFYQHGGEDGSYVDKMESILNDSALNKQYSQAGGGLNIGANGYYWEEFGRYIDANLWKDVKGEFKKYGLNLN